MKFSVVIPNYNSEKWIEKCINSVLNQTFKDYEIIVVDDMSTDSSEAIAYDLLRDKGTVIFNKTKRLNGGTRNVGIAEAQGDYILCIYNLQYCFILLACIGSHLLLTTAISKSLYFFTISYT